MVMNESLSTIVCQLLWFPLRDYNNK